MKKVVLKVELTDEQYAILKASRKSGIPDESTLYFGLHANNLSPWDNLEDYENSKTPGFEFEFEMPEDELIYIKEYNRVMKMLSKK